MPTPTAIPTDDPLDFDRFHRVILPELAAGERGRQVRPLAERLGGLAFRLPEGGAYSLVADGDALRVVPGDEAADTVVELSHDFWQGIVRELEGAAGLLYGGHARCVRGQAIRWVDWEPGLRTLFSGRPIYDPAAVSLPGRDGAPLDPEQSFAESDPRDEMAHFLRTAGYLFVRGVFRREEVEAMRAEADVLRSEARRGDKLSWWATNREGAEVLTRVTRAASQPTLAALPGDPRLVALKDLADEPLEHRGGGEQGVSVIWKNPGITSGLSDLPWHRDCGMGGHAVMCPLLIASVFLTPSNPTTGDLRMLPGSWQAACGPIDASHPRAPRGARFDAAPGDVALHYGDTMHAAPPPEGDASHGYRISAVTGYARPGARHHRGQGNYNEVLHRREDGQIEHLGELVEN